MPIVEKRNKILFIPIIRGNYPAALTVAVKNKVKAVADKLGMEYIMPDDEKYTEGVIRQDDDIHNYWKVWSKELASIKAAIIISGDFMRERVVQDCVRNIPQDIPLFMILNNDNPMEMVNGKVGDSLCGSISANFNLRMMGRSFVRSCRINMHDAQTLEAVLDEYSCITYGIETLRNMRIGMLGINPNEFATTSLNQVKLYELGFSLHNYELIDLWGDTVLGRRISGDEMVYNGEFGDVKLRWPVKKDDSRVEAMKELINKTVSIGNCDLQKFDLFARCLVWVKETFDRDRLDTAAIHCWSEFGRYFNMAPCSFAMLSNVLFKNPVVCEVDVMHAIMAKLAWAMTGEPGVILDINNNGWDPKIFNVFHCSMTPPNWIEGEVQIENCGEVHGFMAAVPFTGVSASTSADSAEAVVFHGHFLKTKPSARGSSGWAVVPNWPEVLETIEKHGLHHFIAMKGLIGNEVSDALTFRGFKAYNQSKAIDLTVDQDLALPEMNQETVRKCCVYTK